MQSTTRSIMNGFAIATGLSDTSREPRRYLWTDAFAVCNFLELYRQTGEAIYLHTARELVDQVHFVLGRYSDADSRRGWISGLDEQAGYEHPTCGGLRIGKQLAERKPDEPYDERLEWERDGQYFHYLTKWMQALARVALVTGEERYQRWARELARASHAGFTYRAAAGRPRRMHWKMSVDLSRPLVASMGHHDPLDGLITYLELEAIRGRYGGSPSDIDLGSEIVDCQAMCAGQSWATDDPLGTGSLLVDTFRLAQIKAEFDVSTGVELAPLLADCEAGLEAFVHSGTLGYPAGHRLAFRELGLSIGLHVLVRLRDLFERHPGAFALTERRQLAKLTEFGHLSDLIERFWLQTTHQQVETWLSHLDINSVMLVTSLAPDGYLFFSAKRASA
jgi:hypothetical protein